MAREIDVRVFAQLGTNTPRLLGRRTLTSKREALRQTSSLLADIAEAMDNEATFAEITDEFYGDG